MKAYIPPIDSDGLTDILLCEIFPKERIYEASPADLNTIKFPYNFKQFHRTVYNRKTQTLDKQITPPLITISYLNCK